MSLGPAEMIVIILFALIGFIDVIKEIVVFLIKRRR